MMPIYLKIKDKKTFNLHSEEELKKNMFAINTTTWYDYKLSNLGLAMRQINANQIKEEAINCIRRYENKKLKECKISNNLELKNIMACNVILSDFTYNNLKVILEQASHTQK